MRQTKRERNHSANGKKSTKRSKSANREEEGSRSASNKKKRSFFDNSPSNRPLSPEKRKTRA